MDAIKAIVRNGHIETDAPIGLPDGTRPLVICSNCDDGIEDDWDDTPEGIAAWLEWYDSLKPLIFTSQERDAWNQDREDRKQWETALS